MTNWRELRGIAAAASESVAGEMALGTLVATSGSTYRRAGARVLIRRDGAMTGAISGGCIDAGLREVARSVLDAGAPRLVRYEAGPDDLVFGSGSGCDGALEILIEPVTDTLLADLAKFECTAEDPLFAVLDTSVDGAPKPSRFLSRDELPLHLRRGATVASRPAEISARGGRLRVERIDPPRVLTIFGATPTCGPLVAFAAAAGWEVRVADSRAAFLRAMSAATAERLIGGALDSLVADADPPPGSAVVVMTHRFDLDERILAPLLGRPLRYLGILGSAERTRRLACALGAAMPSWVHAPAGLDLGAETPEQIALSILAEIEGVFGGGRGEPLRSRRGAIHANAPSGELVIAVLAAGSGKRFGTPKQLARLDGTTLMRRAVDAALSQERARVLVVVDPKQEAIRRELAGLPVAILPNPACDEGIASSLRLAARTAMQLDASGLLILLADQPWIGPAALESLVASWRTDPRAIHASDYPEGAGAPALFPRATLEDLLALEGDEGARALLRGGYFRVTRVGGIDLRDVDVPADLVSEAEPSATQASSH